MAASFASLGRVLSARDARIFFGASLGSWVGLWMHRIAVSWLAWELTGSAFWVGLVAFSDLAPAVVVSPLAGAVADRADRLKLSMFSQAWIGTNAAIVATLVALDMMTIELLLLLEMLSGTAASFAQPARQTLMPGLVPRRELPAAVALNSLCFNVARFLGPGLAGPLIAVAGVWPAIACNSLAYFVATFTMPFLRIDPADRRGHPATNSLLGDMMEGLNYVARHPGIGPIMLFAALSAIFVRGVQEILPPFVERNFAMGAEALAVLTAAFGVGALISGLLVAARGQLAGTTRLAILGMGALAVSTAAFVSTAWFPLGVLCAALMGASGSVHGISVQTLAQSAADPAMRGRVLSIWGVITRACPALSAIMLGASGEIFGLTWPALVSAVLTLVVVALWMTRLNRIAAALEGPADDPSRR